MVAATSSRYEVVCRLAGGGMAELFLARATALAGFQRLVVVKRLASHLIANPAMVQALYDEARIAAALQHANIVQVTDVEVVDSQVSIVMEFLHGHDVSQLLRKLRRRSERLPLDQAIAIGLSVSAGLHHAHDRVAPDGRPLEIVHRDISPHNVVVTYDGAVKIVDFGIARATTRRGHTEAGVIKGKPGYIAPEQLRGKRVDRRTDVWATGVLLYEMTTGIPPYGEDITLDQLVRVVNEDPPPPSARVSDYPRDLEPIVMRALSRDPALRPQSAEELRIALDTFARSRRLDLSPFGLTALMERVFASQLGAWRRAQQQGLSLADHVLAARASRSYDAIDLGADPELNPPSNVVAPDFEPTWPSANAIREVDVVTPIGGFAVAQPHDTESSPPSLSDTAPEPGLRSSVHDMPGRRRWPRLVAIVLASPLVLLAGIASWSLLSRSSHSTPSSILEPEPTTPAASAPDNTSPEIQAGQRQQPSGSDTGQASASDTGPQPGQATSDTGQTGQTGQTAPDPGPATGQAAPDTGQAGQAGQTRGGRRTDTGRTAKAGADKGRTKGASGRTGARTTPAKQPTKRPLTNEDLDAPLPP
jgi:serine/threonine protein kinase